MELIFYGQNYASENDRRQTAVPTKLRKSSVKKEIANKNSKLKIKANKYFNKQQYYINSHYVCIVLKLVKLTVYTIIYSIKNHNHYITGSYFLKKIVKFNKLFKRNDTLCNNS